MSFFPSVSYHLSNILDNLGVSSHMRTYRKTLLAQQEALEEVQEYFNDKNWSRHICGSQVECSTLPGLGSDVDRLTCNNDVTVIRDLSEWTPGRPDHLLMIEDNTTHPGYIKLQMVHRNQPSPIYGHCDGEIVLHVDRLGRTLYKSTLLPKVEGQHYAHQGPAMSHSEKPGYLAVDSVISYRCRGFPKQAYPWIVRYRKLALSPSEDFIQQVINHGCLVVKAGHAWSPEKNLEWRLSFSLAERQMTWNLNLTQLHCYVLLKLVKKTFIQPELGDCLTSYHCKTVIFYLTERTPITLWYPENLLNVFMMCLMTLYRLIARGHCPQYFIPENNLFETKLHGPMRPRLQHLIHRLLTTEGRCLLAVTVDSIGHHLVTACVPRPWQLSYMCYISTETDLKQANCLFIDVLETVACTYMTMLRNSYSKHLYKRDMSAFVHRLNEDLMQLQDSRIAKEFPKLLLIISNFMAFTISTHTMNLWIVHNQATQQNTAGIIKLLMQNISTDVTAGRLKLASVLFAQKNFEDALFLVNNILDYREGHVVLPICACYSSNYHRDSTYARNFRPAFADMVVSEAPSTETLVQKCASFCVVFLPSESAIAPKALRYEMFRNIASERMSTTRVRTMYWHGWIVIDSILYTHYLRYMCYHALNQPIRSRAALQSLSRVIKTEQNLGHRETGLNLLGHCGKEQGWIDLAFRVLVKSMKMYAPTFNAARWHLAAMFSKLIRPKKEIIYERLQDKVLTPTKFYM